MEEQLYVEIFSETWQCPTCGFQTDIATIDHKPALFPPKYIHSKPYHRLATKKEIEEGIVIGQGLGTKEACPTLL